MTAPAESLVPRSVQPAPPREPSSRYDGPERRRHRVYVTENTEYHCRDGLCVAVRDVRSGQFQPQHSVVGETARVALTLRADGIIVAVRPLAEARLGQRLQFSRRSGDSYLLTSALRAIERPPREVVATYGEAPSTRG